MVLWLIPASFEHAHASEGLVAEVYNVQGQNNAPSIPQGAQPIITTTVSNIDFQWGGGSVLGGPSEDVIVRFTGSIISDTTQNISFLATADDGTKLYLDGQLITNDWRDKGGGGTVSAPVSFTAGVPKTIELMYYENGGGANVFLYWDKSGQMEIIPASAFSSTPPAPPEILSIGAPTNLAITDSGTALILNWTAPTDGTRQPERYAISFTTEGQNGWGIATGNVGDSNALNTTITINYELLDSLMPRGTTWSFHIRSDNDTLGLYSANSNTVTLKVGKTDAELAEEAAAVQAAIDAETARLAAIAAEEARVAEEARLAEVARLAEIARLEAVAEAARLAAIKAEEERIAAEKAAAQAAEDARIAEEERIAAEKAEQERLEAIAEAERQAEEEAKAEAERLEAEAEAARQAEQEAKEEADRLKAEEEAAKQAEEDAKAEEEAKELEEAKNEEEALEDIIDKAKDGEELTEEQVELVVDSLLEDLKEGEALSASDIQASGISYSDLPPATPVDIRTDENGNAVVITAEVAAQVELLENPTELFATALSDPGAALAALGAIGADMSEEEREEATDMVVATVVAAGAAINAAAVAAGGATGGSSGGGGGGSGGGSGSNSPGSRGGRRW